MNSSILIGIAVVAAVMLLSAAVISALVGRLYHKRRSSVRRKRTPVLEISTPQEGDGVERDVVIAGTVDPPAAPVQVLVSHGDGFWYPEGSVERDGGKWRAKCTLGTRATPAGHQIRIVAVAYPHVIRSRMADVPSRWPRTQIVTVRRANKT